MYDSVLYGGDAWWGNDELMEKIFPYILPEVHMLFNQGFKLTQPNEQFNLNVLAKIAN